MSLNQKQIKNLVFADVTAAEAAGRPGEICYVQSLKTFYDYVVAGSAYTVDHTSVLSTGNDGNTRWRARAGQYVVDDANFSGLRCTLIELIQATTDTLTAAEMKSTVINNYGQGAANTQTLPTAAEGLNALFIIATVGFAFHIDVQATDKVYLDGAALDDGDKISNATPAIGDSISIIAFQTGASAYDWRAQTIQGTWIDGGA